MVYYVYGWPTVLRFPPDSFNDCRFQSDFSGKFFIVQWENEFAIYSQQVIWNLCIVYIFLVLGYSICFYPSARVHTEKRLQ